ncbi:MAG TPA: MFS transporter [Candidatus Limnocylindrales bacterium]
MPSVRSRGLLVVGILLISATLRPAVSAVGPVLADISADLGLSSSGAALLTSLPVLCFGLLAPFAPRLGRRIGIEATLGAAVAVIAVGQLVRLGPDPLTLFGGTILTGGAVAIANVLVPQLIRRDFHRHVGLMTGVYTSSMTLTSTIAAAATVPIGLGTGLGWRGGLGFWAIPAGLAFVAWLPQMRDRTLPAAVPGAGHSAGRLLRDPLAWAVTIFMGLQSLVFYSTIAWLPSVYRGEGLSPTDAGLLLSVTTLVAIPAGFAVSTFAGRARSQSAAAAAATLLGGVGLVGLTVAPGFQPLLWAVVLGLGQGMTFPLALTMIVLRAGSVETTGRLSAMAQSIGYVLAAAGPFAVGLVHDVVGAWSPAMGLLVLLTGVQVLAGLAAGRPGTVGSGRAR